MLSEWARPPGMRPSYLCPGGRRAHPITRRALGGIAVVLRRYARPFVLDTFRVPMVIEILYVGLFAVSFNLLSGCAGFPSFGYTSTFGVNGYGHRVGRGLAVVEPGTHSGGFKLSRPAGSIRAPPRVTAKCRWAPVARPVAPTTPIGCPASTRSGAATSRRSRWK